MVNIPINDVMNHAQLILSFYNAGYRVRQWVESLQSDVYVIPQDNEDDYEYKTMTRLVFLRVPGMTIGKNHLYPFQKDKNSNVLYMISCFGNDQEYVDFNYEGSVGKLIFYFKERNMTQNLYHALDWEFNECMGFSMK